MSDGNGKWIAAGVVGLAMLGIVGYTVTQGEKRFAEAQKQREAGASTPRIAAPKEHDAGDHDHGPMTVLGVREVAGVEIRILLEGKIKPGGEAGLDIILSDRMINPMVTAWVADGETILGEIETLPPEKPGHFHDHVHLPDPIPPTAKLWIQLEDSILGVVKESFDLQKVKEETDKLPDEEETEEKEST
jgi:hypothetical protein